MPGFSWKDLKKSKTPTSNEVAPLPVRTLEDAAQLSPMLSKLLEQREKLETEMKSLSKGQGSLSGTPARESRIFPVQTLTQRREEIYRWEKDKERQKEKLKENLLTKMQTAITDKIARPENRPKQDNTLPLRQFYSEKEQDRPTKLDLLKDAIPPLRQTAAEKPLDEKLPNKFNQFRDRLTQNLPSDTGYEALKQRLLSVEVGSLEDIGQRLDQQRKAALEKLIQEREQEAQDALRRERALENYKTRQREQEFST
jgi:hypothetical protein